MKPLRSIRFILIENYVHQKCILVVHPLAKLSETVRDGYRLLR